MGRFRRIRQGTSICGRRLYLWSTGVGTLSSLVTVIAPRFIWQRLLIYSIEHRLIGGLDGARIVSHEGILGRQSAVRPESKIVTGF